MSSLFFSQRKLSKKNKKKNRTESNSSLSSVWPFRYCHQGKQNFHLSGNSRAPPVTQHKHVLQSLPLWLIWKERSGFRGSAPLTLPFALVTTWKGGHKCRENRESGPFRSTQPEAMKIAWFQRHTCMAKHGTGRYGRCWNKTHLMFLHVWGRKQEHIFRVWPSFLSTRGLKASS